MELKKLELVEVKGKEHIVLFVHKYEPKVLVANMEGEVEPEWVDLEEITVKRDE